MENLLKLNALEEIKASSFHQSQPFSTNQLFKLHPWKLNALAPKNHLVSTKINGNVMLTMICKGLICLICLGVGLAIESS